MKMYYWIGSSDDNHLNALKVISGKAEESQMASCIYFESEKEANEFLEKLVRFITNNYTRPKVKSWNNEYYNAIVAHYNHFSDLDCKLNTAANEDNVAECIYFMSQEPAKDLLIKIQQFILDNYPRAKRGNWYGDNAIIRTK